MQDRAKAYTKAGVDIDAGNRFVASIKDMVASTFTKGVVTDIGGFGGLFKPDVSDMGEPVLVAGCDGVGTKLNLAFEYGVHDSVGIDLVAMSVNDVLVQGAKPLFFLDYFATGKLDGDLAAQVVSGIVEGCRQSQCALLGGETAEMPDFYKPGEYDLSGFCVGLVDNSRIVDGLNIRPGDRIIGLASSGLHSNGYSLVRKLVAEKGLSGDDVFPGTDLPASKVLLEPTRLYARAMRPLLRDLDVKGMVHVTGGGFYDNVPRVLPPGVRARFQFGSWDVLPVFKWLKDAGGLTWPEMLQIFNCGVGFMVVVAESDVEEVFVRLEASDAHARIIGQVERLEEGGEAVVVDFPESC